MGRGLRFSELMKKLASRSNLTEKSVRKVYDNLFELVAEELRFADEIKLKRFGTFYTVQRGGRDKQVPNPDGTLTLKYIEPYQKIRFKPSADFENYANGKLVNKESKKRRKRGVLTKSEQKLLEYKTDDRQRNLQMEIERMKDGKR